MQEIRTSGSMSGDGKRSVAAWPKLPRLSSTLPQETVSSAARGSAFGGAVEACVRGPGPPPTAPLRKGMRLHVFRDQHDGQSASNRSGTCEHRQRQISKARQTSIGSAFVL